jgi:hypothetical protein
MRRRTYGDLPAYDVTFNGAERCQLLSLDTEKGLVQLRAS